MGRLIALLLDCLILVGAVAASPFLLWKFLRVKRWRAGFRSRLTLTLPPAEGRDGIWIHTVSAGELLTAIPLIRSLSERFPEMPQVLSVTTEAGRRLAADKLPDLPCFFWPVDFSPCVNRVLRFLRPKLIVLVELEVWPNFLLSARRLGIPAMVVNGRISERCARRWNRFKPVARWLFRHITHFAVQNREYAERLKGLGVTPDAISICGNLKFDVPRDENTPVAPVRSLMALPEDKPLVVAGCTHPGEEALLVKVLPELNMPGLVLAPRHLERVGEVIQVVNAAGYDVVTYPGGDDHQPAGPRQAGQAGTPDKAAPVVVVDQFGMLDGLYRAADAVFMGGTFVPHGGHNFLEPARWGKPIVFGQSIDNFRDIAVGLILQNAAFQAQTEDDLVQAFTGLLASPQERERLGERAFDLWRQGKGAVHQYTERVAQLMGQQPLAPEQ